MIITQTIRIGKVTGDYAFAGDPYSEWFCEIIDAEFGNEPNPIVNSVRMGWINLTCKPRHLNATFKVAFHGEAEKAEVAKLETVTAIASSIPDALLPIFAKLALWSKKLAFTIFALFILSTIFAAVKYAANMKGADLSWFFDRWEQANAANGARVITKTVKEVKGRLTETVWDSPGIKAIEKETGYAFEDLFSKVSDDFFVMDDIMLDENDNPMLVSHGDAEDLCDQLGSELLQQEELTVVLAKFGIHRWNKTPEWTSNSYGLFSDDYALFKKEGIVPNNGYVVNNLVYGDAEDVSAAVRCGFTRDTFME